MNTLILILLPSVFAFESDQWTHRGQPLVDALPLANEKAAEFLVEAVEAANRRTHCSVHPDEARRILAAEVHEVMGRPARVPARGRLPPMAFGAYAAWMEMGPLDRRTFLERDDIYSKVPWWQNLLLAAVGPASTFRFGDVLVGADKIDHFWVQGYMYWRKSRWGRDEDRAVQWGTYTERSYWGQGTTDTFSFADLAANYGGYTFYASLLQPDSAFQLDSWGCIVQTRPWDWADWVDWQFDEAQNPPAYQPEVLEILRRYFIEHRDAICDGLAPEDIDSLAEQIRVAADQVVPYVSGRAPEHEELFDIEALCRQTAPPAGSPPGP